MEADMCKEFARLPHRAQIDYDEEAEMYWDLLHENWGDRD